MTQLPVLLPEEEGLAFHYAIGLAVANWAHVENGLFHLALRCISEEGDGLGAAFYSIENFRSKLAFVTRAVEFGKHASFMPEWEKLAEKISGLSTKRNRIAHGYQMIYMDAEPGRRYALIPLYKRSNGIKNDPYKPPNGSLCVKDIEVLGRQFSRIWSECQSLYDRMGGDEDHFAGALNYVPEPYTLKQIRSILYTMTPQGRSEEE